MRGGGASHYESEHKASLIFTAPYLLSFSYVSSYHPSLLTTRKGSENILILTVYEYTSVKSHNSYHSTQSADMQVSSYTTVTVCYLVCKYAICDDSCALVCYKLLALTFNFIYTSYNLYI
jgi:hypothetical protein